MLQVSKHDKDKNTEVMSHYDHDQGRQKAVSTLVLFFFAPGVLLFGLCLRTACAAQGVHFFGSSCANVLAISTDVLSFGRLALCTVLMAYLC